MPYQNLYTVDNSTEEQSVKTNVFNVFDQSETYMAKLDSVLTECGLV